MNYQKHLHWTSCFLVLTGFLSILITNSYVVVTILGIVFTTIYYILGENLTRFFPIPQAVLNLLIVVIFGYLAYDGLFGKLDLIGNSIIFVVILQIIKLIAKKTSRDWMQIYALSFLHIIASTVVSSDVTFAIPFLLFVVLATWTFILFNIKKQLEDTVSKEQVKERLDRLLNSRSLVKRRFFTGTFALTVIMLAAGLLIFFIFPRMSFKNFLTRTTHKQKISGFSSEIELGTIGTIKTSESIVMRVELSETHLNELDVEEFYWRGTAADFFDGRKWKQTFTDTRRINLDPEAPFIELSSKKTPKGKRLEYSIFMESLSTPLIFMLDGTYRISWDKPMVERILRRAFLLEKNEIYGTFNFIGTENFASDLTFKAEAIIDTNSKESDSSQSSLLETPLLTQHYLQLPIFQKKVHNVLESIKPDRTSVQSTINSIIKFLEKNYKYTLAVEDKESEDPLTHFLVTRKEGHCEYFATALIMALRHYGIPSRIVMGFRGGEINHYGNYIAVRQKDAHSWVEAFDKGKGNWVRLDPSPDDSIFLSNESTYLKPFYHLVDFARLRWTKYILEYDLRAQGSALEKAGKFFNKIFPKKGKRELIKEEIIMERDPSPVNELPWNYVVKTLSVISLLGMFFYLRRYRRLKNRHGYYADVLKILARHQISRAPHQTPQEVCVQIEQKLGDVPSLRTLTSLYYAWRFQGVSPDRAVWNQHLKRLKLSLKRLA